ncbi:transcription factor E [Methanotorris formicicus]|uniref:Transcription factor E n=1 Tax=Methanotorris formicicus Mc-S-70 TaxID=647171 RepID=H1KYD8_9EURY|nr:transcription factor E [Methanotorris formicicus]EHP87222.1 Transcription factor TFIIE, alpha subunit [Methanotorris formicicus Mc-S-70]
MKLSKEEIYKMFDNHLVQEVLFDIFEGEEEGFEILDALLELGEATDDEIARKLNLKLNLVRKLLYKIYEARLVDYKREKDEETNWYTYTWKPTIEKLPYVVKKKVNHILDDLKKRLEFEENNMFFYCPECNLRFVFDEAMETGFRCPRCDGILQEFDNREIIRSLKEQISFFESEIKTNSLFSK